MDSAQEMCEAKEEGVTTESRASRGFSLVELLVVIVVIAILTAVAIPLGLDFVRSYQMMGAAQSLAAYVQATRAQAVKRNTNRGLILNFDYPGLGQYQFTSLDPDPMTGNWDGGIYPGPGPTFPFNPNNRNYGIAPTPPDNEASPGDGLPSPHGTPMFLHTNGEIQFDVTGTWNALLFRSDGSVEAVNATQGGNAVIGQSADGIDWVVTVRHMRYQLTRTLLTSRSGRVRILVQAVP